MQSSSVIGNLYGKGKELVMGQIARAVLEFCDKDGDVETSMECAFNPTEYSISHSLQYHHHTGHGKQYKLSQTAPVREAPAVLTVTLLLDNNLVLRGTLVNMAAKLLSKVGKVQTPSNVKEICQLLESCLHYPDQKKENAPKLAFSWGDMRFVGALQSLEVKYVKFERSGNPERALATIRILGDDDYFIQEKMGAAASVTESGKAANLAKSAADKLGLLNPRNLI